MKGLSLAVVSFCALIFNLRYGRIPNLLTISGIIGGFALNLLESGIQGLVTSLLGLAAGMGMLLPGYILKQTRAGSVKLLGCVGAIGGMTAVVISASIGSVILLTVLVVQSLNRLGLGLKGSLTVLAGAQAHPELLSTVVDTGKRVPFGTWLSIGTLLTAGCLSLFRWSG